MSRSRTWVFTSDTYERHDYPREEEVGRVELAEREGNLLHLRLHREADDTSRVILVRIGESWLEIEGQRFDGDE